MTMHDLYSFSDDNLPYDAQYHKHVEERVLTKEWDEGEMVDFHSIAEIPDSHAFFVIEVSHDDNLVTSLYETLAKLKHMHFYSSQVGIEVVTDK